MEGELYYHELEEIAHWALIGLKQHNKEAAKLLAQPLDEWVAELIQEGVGNNEVLIDKIYKHYPNVI